MDPELTRLLDQARRGDAAAMGEVAAAFREAALRMARAVVVDPHEAEDVAQDALLLAFTRLGALREPQAFAGWLQALVRTAASRRARRRRPDLLEDADVAGDEPDPGADLAGAEVRQAVRDALRGLTPRLQAVLERHYLEGLPVAEIAARLGLPEGTVKRRLFDARERLRPSLLGLAPRPIDTTATPQALRVPLHGGGPRDRGD